MLPKLPLDLSTFRELRTSHYVYVDKTEHMYNMITGGRRFFLSRPRRFGKSLLVSTLKEILLGNKDLFNDLWIAQSDYQWKEHGVIALDFSLLKTDDVTTFKHRLHNALLDVATNYQINITSKSDAPDLALKELVAALNKRFGRVAFLVDEYDSPILRSLNNHEHAKVIRDELQFFFTVLKGLDAQVNFAFITGVSSFAKAGLFSGINNLTILTLNEKYAAICGYTDAEVDLYFKDYIDAWTQKDNVSYDQLRKQMKTWYNGYRFGDKVVAIYNPFSVMHALNIQEFNNFWFQSGTPTFLVDVLKKEYKNFDPEELVMTKDALGIFDVGATPLLALMFQSGYLTIVDYDPETQLYTLNYPNLEVKRSFQKYLLEVFAHLDSVSAARISSQLYTALNQHSIEKAVTLIKQLFTHVPYQLHIPEEKFYHALLQMACTSTGIKAQSEYSISHGRIDLILDLPNFLYIVEVKFNKPAQEALDQIKERHYYERFIGQEKPIILLGLSFERKPSHFEVTYVMEELNT